MIIFILYEAKVAKNPIIPLALLCDRTSLGGYAHRDRYVPVFTHARPRYFQAFICPVVILAVSVSVASG